MKDKCLHRQNIENKIQAGEVLVEDSCFKCYGFRTSCENYVDLSHLLTFYELFKQDKQITQNKSDNYKNEK